MTALASIRCVPEGEIHDVLPQGVKDGAGRDPSRRLGDKLN